jgi:hypothetical protein
VLVEITGVFLQHSHNVRLVAQKVSGPPQNLIPVRTRLVILASYRDIQGKMLAAFNALVIYIHQRANLNFALDLRLGVN